MNDVGEKGSGLAEIDGGDEMKLQSCINYVTGWRASCANREETVE